MAWVKMLATDRHTLPTRRTVRYDAERVYSVKRDVCRALVARGTAIEIRAPGRGKPEGGEP